MSEKEDEENNAGEDKAGDRTLEVERQSEELDDSEYPKGLRLLAVVVALVLSIFLVALDMVGPHHHPTRCYCPSVTCR